MPFVILMLLLFFIVENKKRVANTDGVKELVDLTNEALGENSKYVATDNDGDGYKLKER